MISYVTVTDAKTWCRIDEDEDDLTVRLLINAASSAVKNYLKTTSPFDPDRDENDNPILDSNGDIELLDYVRPEVRVATLFLVAEWYKNREASQDLALGHGYLPAPVVAILYPLRDPTCQ